MATSGTYNFNLAIDEIIEEAYERVGIEVRGAWQLKSARRSLDILLTQWANEGINLWTVEEISVSLAADTATYTLSPPYNDILDAIIRDSSGNDISMDRISLSEYMSGYTNKTTEGRPNVYTIRRASATTGSTIYLWPVPTATTSTMRAWAVRHIEDTGAYTNNIEVPKRFLPALISGLAYYLSMKEEKTPPEKIAMLRQQYMEDFNKAKDEDRERASLFILPVVR